MCGPGGACDPKDIEDRMDSIQSAKEMACRKFVGAPERSKIYIADFVDMLQRSFEKFKRIERSELIDICDNAQRKGNKEYNETVLKELLSNEDCIVLHERKSNGMCRIVIEIPTPEQEIGEEQ